METKKIQRERGSLVYKKGIGFELEFANYMKTELGWTGYKIRPTVYAFGNGRGTNVDIIAMKDNPKGIQLTRLYYLFLLLPFPIVLCGLVVLFKIDNIGFFIYTLLLAGLSLAGTYYVEKKCKEKYRTHAWVECKNLKGKATIEQVTKMIDEYRRYQSMPVKEYNLSYLFFVSAEGFVENALKHALENKVNCYRKDETGNFISIQDYCD